MDDIISHGPDREPSRLGRPAAAALILATLIVLAVVAVGRLPRHDAARPHHRPVAGLGPVQLAGLGPSAARMLNGDSPDHMPYPPGGHAGRCHHVLPGNHDFQLASLAACH